MKAERKTQILTILLLVAVVGLVVVRQGGISGLIPTLRRQPDATPQDAIYAMLDAARAGDVKKYLASYTGPLAQSLKQTAAESSDFATYLKDSNAALKGIAVNDPELLPNGGAKARVEYVYQDRNEIQYFYLDKTEEGWKIARVDAADRVKTLTPYGTPVK